MHWGTMKGKNSEMLFNFILCWFRDSNSHRKYFGHGVCLFNFVSERKAERPVQSFDSRNWDFEKNICCQDAFLYIHVYKYVCVCVCVCIQNTRWWSRCCDSRGPAPFLQIKHGIVFRNFITKVIQLRSMMLRNVLGITFCDAEIMMWMIIIDKISPSYYWTHHKIDPTTCQCWFNNS